MLSPILGYISQVIYSFQSIQLKFFMQFFHFPYTKQASQTTSLFN